MIFHQLNLGSLKIELTFKNLNVKFDLHQILMQFLRVFLGIVFMNFEEDFDLERSVQEIHGKF